MPSKKTGQRSLRVQIEIQDGYGKRNLYDVRPLRPVEGTGWRLYKLGMVKPVVLEKYAIYHTEDSGLTCDCKGFVSRGYCKHTDAFKVILGALLTKEAVNV